MTKKQIIGCIIGGLIILSGIVGSVVYIIAAIVGNIGEGNQILVPGEVVIDLQEPGEYVIYHEFVSNYEGRIFNQEPGQSINGLNIEILSESNREKVELQQTGFTSNYSISSKQGVSILLFTIEECGKYRVKATYPNGKGNEAILNIQQGVFEFVFTPILYMFAIFGGSLIIGASIILYSIFKFRKK